MPTGHALGYATGSAAFAGLVGVLVALLARRAQRILFLPVLWVVAAGVSMLGFDTHTLRDRREMRATLQRKVADIQNRARTRKAGQNVFEDAAVAVKWNEGVARIQRLAKEEEEAQRELLGVGGGI